MQVLAVMLSPSDIRCYVKEDGYRVGVYLERDKPGKANTRANLCVYRVPTGTQAPVGRIPDAMLLKLADEGTRKADPEVIARLPYFSYIVANGQPVDAVGEPGAKNVQVPVEDAQGNVTLRDATIEDLQILPPSDIDGMHGAYIEPANAFTPLNPPKAAAKPADPSADKATRPAKEG